MLWILLELCVFTAWGPGIQPLFWDPKSHKLHGQYKKKKKKTVLLWFMLNQFLASKLLHFV